MKLLLWLIQLFTCFFISSCVFIYISSWHFSVSSYFCLLFLITSASSKVMGSCRKILFLAEIMFVKDWGTENHRRIRRNATGPAEDWRFFCYDVLFYCGKYPQRKSYHFNYCWEYNSLMIKCIHKFSLTIIHIWHFPLCHIETLLCNNSPFSSDPPFDNLTFIWIYLF